MVEGNSIKLTARAAAEREAENASLRLNHKKTAMEGAQRKYCCERTKENGKSGRGYNKIVLFVWFRGRDIVGGSFYG